jgi:hypothetical protein
MAVHMSFDFSDSECSHTPVIVRIEKDLAFKQMTSIDEAVQKKINEYVENEEYWDSDECLLDEVIKQFADELEFKYEFITINYESVC